MLYLNDRLEKGMCWNYRQWLVNLMHSIKETLRNQGHFDILMEEVAKKVETRNAEEELFASAREMQERLTRMRQDETIWQRRRKEEEERLRAELLRLRVRNVDLCIKCYFTRI